MPPGVLIVGPGYTEDGDAYTLEGVCRPVPTTAPVIAGVAPATFAHTDPPTTLVVTGTGFMRADRIMFGGATPPTNFHSDTELSFEVKPSQWSAGTVGVAIAWSSRGPSNIVDFVIT